MINNIPICSLGVLIIWFFGFQGISNPTWQYVSDFIYFTVRIEKKTVSIVLEDGQGDFDPWNQIRWADWYDREGRIIKPFELDTSVKFQKRADPWALLFSDRFEGKFVLPIVRQGIHVDGNGVVLDTRTPDQKLPLEDLFALKKAPWSDGSCEIGGIFNNLVLDPEKSPTVVKNLTFKGFKRGVKVNSPNDFPGPDNEEKGVTELRQHRLIVKNCFFHRNRVGFYTNGYNTLVQSCEFSENGYGAIYSGSRSRRNQFTDNVFRDNTLSQNQHSYGDFIGDTFFDSEISNNRFVKSHIKGDCRRIGISIFRNMGESNNLREQMPHNNIIRNNSFDGYSVAIHVGARMGRNTRNDIALEGRDYAFYNLIDGNHISHTSIGIKINTEGNTVLHNSFVDVEQEIVLQCVFFELKNTTINYQRNATVKCWYTLDDYKEYAEWFRFQDDLNGSISKNEKVIEVFSNRESPSFSEKESDQFVVNPPGSVKKSKLSNHRFGLPIKVDTGEFSLDLPGQELVAIWHQPISRIDSVDYYTILIFDENGTEINRCGRSEQRWTQITTGYFTQNRNDGEMQIAAVSDADTNGKYPVFVFNRGFKEPIDMLYVDNTDPKIKISSTNDDQLRVDFK